MVDIVPALLEEIQKGIEKNLIKNKKIKGIIEASAVTMADANTYALNVGSCVSDALLKNITAEILPDGRMYYNIADRIMNPILQDNAKKVSDVAISAQDEMLKSAGIGMRAQAVPINTDRISGFIDRLSGAESFDDIKWILGEPVRNFMQSVVSESYDYNAKALTKTGLKATIERTLPDSGCCKWCKSLAGVYVYGEHPEYVFAHHENCRCLVIYKADKKYQDVWSKKIYEDEKQARKEQYQFLEELDKRGIVGRRNERKAEAERKKRAEAERKKKEYLDRIYHGKKPNA